MTLFIHHLKVAMRHLMKYKLQTLISVLSIAIGIVTLAFSHAALKHYTFPHIYHQPYFDRTFNVGFQPADTNPAHVKLTKYPHFTANMIRAIKRDGGPKSAERMAMPNGMVFTDMVAFRLPDATARKLQMEYAPIDPEYFHLAGIRSALTGKVIARLKPGEAVVSRQMAKRIFGEANPVGAVTTQPLIFCPMTLKIVDVFDDVSAFELVDKRQLYFSLGEAEKELCDMKLSDGHELFYTTYIHVVLKEGYTRRQLLAELDARLKPFGYVATLSEPFSADKVRTVVTTQTLVHLIGALILIAALSGFLRMEVQLFRMRRRELALRTVHGAKRGQLFRLLFTEVLLVIIASVAVAMCMGSWLEHFIGLRFEPVIRVVPFSVESLAVISLCIGGALIVACAAIIRLTLSQTKRAEQSEQGLAIRMRHGRSHLFRHVMLTVEIAISLLFVCSTLSLVRWTDLMAKYFHVPDNLAPYKECILLQAHEASESPGALLQETSRLPSLKTMIPHDIIYLTCKNIKENAEVQAALDNHTHLPFFAACDTSLVSFYNLRVNWLQEPADTGRFVLLSDSIYQRLRRLGAVDEGSLTMHYGRNEGTVLPIAGTIGPVPYENRPLSIIVSPEMAYECAAFVLVPKEGQHEALVHEVDAAVRRFEPAVVSKMAVNFHDSHTQVTLCESMRSAGYILGVVSLIVCAMSIYSTVALDTRSRRKEVAIRRVNGAKRSDIYRLFGRVYLVVTALALCLAIPAALLFHRYLFGGGMSDVLPFVCVNVSPLLPCLGGALLVIALVAVIVVRSVRLVMRTNPSQLIAKE